MFFNTLYVTKLTLLTKKSFEICFTAITYWTVISRNALGTILTWVFRGARIGRSWANSLEMKGEENSLIFWCKISKNPLLCIKFDINCQNCFFFSFFASCWSTFCIERKKESWSSKQLCGLLLQADYYYCYSHNVILTSPLKGDQEIEKGKGSQKEQSLQIFFLSSS